LFLVVLNGSFIFAADLMREITIPCELAFIKLSSYDGLTSTGKVKELIGLNQSIASRNVIIVEDIVDTGTTLEEIWNNAINLNPSNIEVATALYKPDAYKKKMPIKYIGMEIPNDFVIGYGLDYKEIGRNLKSIYKLASP
jgi:hypoxanthine phosphoribosyltransferase